MADGAPRVLVDLEPAVYAETIGRELAGAGFRVTIGRESGTERFDAVVTDSGRGTGGAVTVIVGPEARAVVHRGGETGFVSLHRPADLTAILGLLFADLATEG